MFAELRELLRSGAIRRHQLGKKYLLTPTSYDHFTLFYSSVPEAALAAAAIFSR